jgi:hypothetical protein
MRHIKLYEDYSDDDLKDLIGDLEEIGLLYQPKFGVDYGYLSSGEITSESPKSDFERPSIIFSEEAKKYLIKKKILEDPKSRSMPDPNGWIKFIPEEFWNEKDLPRYKGETMRFYIRRHQTKDYYFLIGHIAAMFTGFGFPTRSIDAKARSIAQKNFLEKMEKTIKKLGAI